MAMNSIKGTQESIQQLDRFLQSNQALQASALVGRKVLVNNNIMNLGQESGAKIVVDIFAEISGLTISIYADLGELVRKIPLGQGKQGLFEFSWDGLNQKGNLLRAGKYTIKVSGLYRGKEVSLKTMTAANVDSVSLGPNGKGVKLNIAGIGPVSLHDVEQVTG